MNSHKVDKVLESKTLSFLCENRFKLNVLLKWLPTHGPIKTLRISSDNKSGFCEYSRQDSADNAAKYSKNDLRCNGICIEKGLKLYREPMDLQLPSKSNIAQPVDKQSNPKLTNRIETITITQQMRKKQSKKRKRDEDTKPLVHIKQQKTVEKPSPVKQEIKPIIEVQPQPQTTEIEYISYNDSTDDEDPIFDLNISPEEKVKQENSQSTTDSKNDLYVIRGISLHKDN
jgi:hypothetical protein